MPFWLSVSLSMLWAAGFGYSIAFLKAAMYVRRQHLPMSIRTADAWQVVIVFAFFSVFWPVTLGYLYIDEREDEPH